MIHSLRIRWGSNFIVYERWLSLALGVLVAILYLRGPLMNPVNDLLSGNRASLYGVIASIAGALLGFSITVTSIVLGVWSSPRLKLLKESPASRLLWQTFSSTNRVLALVTSIALVCLIFDKDLNPMAWCTVALIIVSPIAVARIWRMLWVLDSIIAIVGNPVSAPGRASLAEKAM